MSSLWVKCISGPFVEEDQERFKGECADSLISFWGALSSPGVCELTYCHSASYMPYTVLNADNLKMTRNSSCPQGDYPVLKLFTLAIFIYNYLISGCFFPPC